MPAAITSARPPASPVVTAPPSPSLRPAGAFHSSSEQDKTSPPSPSPLPRPGSTETQQQQQQYRYGLPSPSDRLSSAVRVLNAEAAALTSLAHLYSSDPSARAAFDGAASAVARSQTRGGTLVVSGVGKSGHIARKLAATFSSLSVRASFMHPTEALHGDLGLLAPRRDAVLLVSFSGRTPELHALASHLHPSLPVVVVTAAPDDGCEIAALLRSARTRTRGRRSGSAASSSSTTSAAAGEGAGEEEEGGGCYDESDGGFGGAEVDGRTWTTTSSTGDEDTKDGEEQHGAPVVVLPAPIPISEVDCLGIAAPTASTTVALALGDALAVVVGRELHGGVEGVASVFARNHPGGAIGAAMSASRGTPSPSRFDDSRPETPG